MVGKAPRAILRLQLGPTSPAPVPPSITDPSVYHIMVPDSSLGLPLSQVERFVRRILYFFPKLFCFGIKSETTMHICISGTCLLYTSDAADERSSVDLGG